MTELSLPLPLRGISDALAFGAQHPETTREAQNMRGQDPTNRRIRPSQRAGLLKANDTALVSATKVAELAEVVFDNRKVSYDFTSGSESIEWSENVPSGSRVRRGTADDQGNVYALDGDSAIVKFNPDGKVVWQFPLPSQDEEDIVRFLHVDDLGDVYAGVSDGRRQGLARFWKLTQLPDNEVEVAWTVQTSAFIERGKVRQDKLYTIQNEPDTKSAWVRVYAALDAAAPQLDTEFLVPYPARGFDVKPDGSIIVCTPKNGDEDDGVGVVPWQRGPNPRFPKTSPVMIDWTPFDLDDADRRLWRWHASEDIRLEDVRGRLVDGSEVLRWPDRSGNGRDLFKGTTENGPTYVRRAHTLWPGVRFDGSGVRLETRPNTSSRKEYADQQQTIVPAYEDAMWCAFFVVRVENAATVGTIFQQDHPGTSHALRVNQTDSGGTTAGEVRHETDVDLGDPGAGSGGQVLDDTYTNDNDVIIVTIQYCGGVEGANPGTGFTRSMFRVNGKPVDRYEGGDSPSLVRSLIGSDGSLHLRGDILEIVVLDRRDRDDNSEANYGGGVPAASGGGKVLQHEPFGSDPGGDDQATGTQTETEITNFEGYLAHKHGVAHLLPDHAATYPHPHGNTNSGGNQIVGTYPPKAATAPEANTTFESYGASHAALLKFSPTGRLLAAINGTTVADQDGDLSGGQVGGIGYDCIVNSDGNVYSMGPTFPNATPAEDVQVAMFVDNGTSFDASASGGGWGVSIGDATPDYEFPQLDVDGHDNLYVPVAASSNPLRVYKKDGTLLSDVTLTSGEQARAVKHFPRIPDYEGDLTDPIAEFCYVFTDRIPPPVSTGKGVHKVRLVTASAAAGSPRAFQLLGIAGDGQIRTFELGAAAPSTPTGASGALSASAPYYRALPIQGEIVLSDGLGDLQVYDPRDDEVTLLEATSAGSPPHRAKILEKWQNRLVAARAVGLINEAFSWTMSKIGDFRDWDNFPPENDPSAAVSGANLAGPGLVQDIVNGFVPFNDDLGLFLCDHSTWWLTGNPRDGGEFDLLSDEWGGSFGRAWAKDPDGNVYVYGSRGGIYKVHAGGGWERLTLNNIEARLREVDLSTNYIRMAWNDDDEGLHIFQFPFGSPAGSPLNHWFWDTRIGAAWQDLIGSSSDTSVQPTAVLNHDADDPDDRLLLVGCEDGFVRKWDSAAKDDDGVAIDARLMIGSLAKADVRREMRWVGPRAVLANEQDGCLYELFAADEPTVPGTARRTGTLGPGRNPMKRSRVRGSFCFLRLVNSQVGQRFAVEEMAMQAYPAGQKRVRQEP